MKKLLTFTYVVVVVVLFSGCSMSNFTSNDNTSQYAPGVFSKKEHIHVDLNNAVIDLGNQLFANKIATRQRKKIAITSFVDLNQLNKTTTFGRVLGESMINELHVRGFRVSDFRGQDAISINATGEFHITRDIAKVKPKIANSYILVGTYSLFDYDSIAINTRLINFDTGEVISSGRIVYAYADCNLFDLCKSVGLSGGGKEIKLITDNCSTTSCPDKQCSTGICPK